MTLNFDIILALAGAIAAVAKWVYEYSRKNKWEKNKYLLDELEKFHAQETVKNAEFILDWNSRKITYKGKEYEVDDFVLSAALETHDKKKSFTPTEVAIRAIFDDYFDHLTRFVFMCKVGLIDEKNFKLFMRYWFKIMDYSTKSKPYALIFQMHNYMKFYGYNDLLEFIENNEFK